MSQARHRPCAMVSLYSPPMPRPPTGRPRMDGVIRRSRIHRLRSNLDLILDQRGADMVDVPGGASGLLVRDYKGEEQIGW